MSLKLGTTDIAGIPTGLIDTVNGKVDVSSLSTCHVVIDTYINGTSGYRIWDDGYCEQWGLYDNGSTVRDKSGISISLLKTYSDKNYTVLALSYKNNNALANRTTVANLYYKTNSSMVMGWYGIASDEVGQYLSWKTSGYLADGEW